MSAVCTRDAPRHRVEIQGPRSPDSPGSVGIRQRAEDGCRAAPKIRWRVGGSEGANSSARKESLKSCAELSVTLLEHPLLRIGALE